MPESKTVSFRPLLAPHYKQYHSASARKCGKRSEEGVSLGCGGRTTRLWECHYFVIGCEGCITKEQSSQILDEDTAYQLMDQKKRDGAGRDGALRDAFHVRVGKSPAAYCPTDTRRHCSPTGHLPPTSNKCSTKCSFAPVQ